MKIRALRALEVGQFGGAVALEGLSGGFDVLAGPNELGKSTLFRALSLLISEKHTSTAKAVQSLRPNSGGAPLIEADLEIDGRTWRLRKRYLAQRMAELVDLDSSQVWRGADAEGRVESLLHAGGRAPMRGLVWVAQASSFELPVKDGEIGSALAALIEQEAAAATGLGRARRVREMVAAQLGQMITARGPKAGSELARAIEARNVLQERLESARQRAAAMQQRIEDLARFRSERELAAAPEVAEAARAEIERLRRELAEANTARERKQTADAQVKAQQLQRDAAVAALALHDRQVAEIARSEAEHRKLSAELAALEPQLATRNGELLAARERRAGLAAAIAAQRRGLAGLEVRELVGKIRSARSAKERVEALDARIASCIDDGGLAAVRRCRAQIDVLEARVAAGSPRISVSYSEQGIGRVRVSGRSLAEGEAVLAERRLELEIEGVGTVVIEPAVAKGEDPLALRDAERGRLSQLLAGLGVADLQGAEAAAAERRELERERAELGAQLRAIAPGGLEPLERAYRSAIERSGESAGDALGDRQEIEHGIAQLEREIGAADGDIARLAAAVHALDTQRTRVLTSLAGLAERLTGAPVDEGLESAARERLIATVEAGESALATAVLEASSWARVVLSAEQHAALKRRLEEAEAALRIRGTRLHEIERALADREGALRRDGEDGTGGDIAGLEEQLSTAQARVDDLELDVAALSLLAARLDDKAASHRQNVLRPIVERLEPALRHLHAGASVALDGPMLIARLEREGGSHTLQQLSDGTREQIAVLVRLAYAGLLAERGAALPVVLDDALAFSDDRRFAAMLELLSQAAGRHQVIMLSCREEAVTGIGGRLGANLLQIEPWHMQERTAAGRAGRSRNVPERKAS